MTVAQDILTNSVEAYRTEYRELSTTWRDLDSKAQGSVAIAGIFLAATFAFARDLTNTLGAVELSLLLAGVILLVLSVVCAVVALWLREVLPPPVGEEFHALVEDLLGTDPSEHAERAVNLTRDEIGMWHQSNADLFNKNKSKARWLLGAQVLLTIAILTVTLLTAVSIISSFGGPVT